MFTGESAYWGRVKSSRQIAAQPRNLLEKTPFYLKSGRRQEKGVAIRGRSSCREHLEECHLAHPGKNDMLAMKKLC